MSDGEATRARRDLPADRLVYFSDAVVAIAITLLVLPLVEVVPESRARHEPVRELLAHNTGPILAFLLSFVVISRLWSSHHSVFDGVERVRRHLVPVNAVWLLTIVVLPFPTALTGTASDDPFTARLYVGVLAVNLLTMTLLSALVHRHRPPSERGRSRAMASGVGSAAVVVVLGFVLLLVAPALGFGVLLLLFVSPVVERVIVAVLRRRSGSTA